MRPVYKGPVCEGVTGSGAVEGRCVQNSKGLYHGRMGAPALVGIAALAGSIAGGQAGKDAMRGTVEWAHAVHRADLHLLALGQELPPIEEPPSSSRTPRNGLLMWLAGPLVGAALGFVVVLLFVQLLAEASPEVTGFERLLGGVFFGLFGAGVGALLGAFIGILVYLLEMRARLGAFRIALRRAVWEQREQLRSDLREGRIEPARAIAELEQAIST